jgi:hypothetical protein
MKREGEEEKEKKSGVRKQTRSYIYRPYMKNKALSLYDPFTHVRSRKETIRILVEKMRKINASHSIGQ